MLFNNDSRELRCVIYPLLDSIRGVFLGVFLEQANDQSVVTKTGSQKGLKVRPRPDCA